MTLFMLLKGILYSSKAASLEEAPFLIPYNWVYNSFFWSAVNRANFAATSFECCDIVYLDKFEFGWILVK